MKTIIALFLALLVGPAFAQDSFEILGVPLGATQASIVQAHPDAKCEPGDAPLSEVTCHTLGYGGDDRAIVMYYVVGGTVESAAVMFDHDGFARVFDGLVAKYGPPMKDETEAVGNAAGAQFPSRKAGWARDGVVLTATERFGRIDRSGVELVSLEGRKAFAQRKAAEASRLSDSL